MKSNFISKCRPDSCGIAEVVSPRGETYSGTCQQWFTGGSQARRILPAICSQRCSVA